MNCSIDEYGPVDIDELLVPPSYGPRMVKLVSSQDSESEPNIKRSELIKIMGSQEWVGELTNSQWALQRRAHKNNDKSGLCPLIDSQSKLMGSCETMKTTKSHTHTWAQVVSE
jgi:hypothetical protein